MSIFLLLCSSFIAIPHLQFHDIGTPYHIYLFYYIIMNPYSKQAHLRFTPFKFDVSQQVDGVSNLRPHNMY